MAEELPLFVYGTLRAGAGTPWAAFLASVSTFLGKGVVEGRMFLLDGYPGMTASGGSVTGDVCRMNDPARDLPVLDEHEGDEYRRTVVAVQLENGESVGAWAYVYCGETSGRVEIGSGDYLRP